MLVPRYTQELKSTIEAMSALVVERANLKDKIRDARLYFSKDRTKQEMVNGSATLHKYLNQIEKVDLDIRDQMTRFAVIIEENAGDLKFEIDVAKHLGTDGEPVDRKTLSFGNEDSDITPESIWFLQMAKKLFGADSKDVKIL